MRKKKAISPEFGKMGEMGEKSEIFGREERDAFT